MVDPILTLRSVVAGYGAGDILKGVDLDVRPATVTCLIGPNGAGKSTVLRCVSGLLRPSRGSVVFRDEMIDRLSPRQRLDRGIVHVPQERSLFPAMTVWDNLLMGGYTIRDRKRLRERVEHVAEAFPVCVRRARDDAGSLSGGEQKQVELARTLVLDPSLVLLDEPSIGLDPRSRQQVFGSIRGLADRGVAVLLVEQNARSGLAASDVGAVLETGVVRLVDSGASLLANPEVARLYLGGLTRTTTGET
ncbi:ABC transporter ATP-binding protein [Kutzneria buriramensis]|uniref:Branched-chain amino acid transport system ATP-binding protein n=1 Tax=Kutzneria buriramensis TaxID=1045776 RepID=A0A3E0HI64_9PSEU|nr:ABC transporter ATP-binding protein [Kutzneria buriramensis]REH46123.1 branched-chain amino acid transport system ATP-binding protein [Kutzneria buriramensis]